MIPRVTVDPSTVRKVSLLTGETDRERGPNAFSNHTHTRFGLYGTDLGSSFEHAGRLWFLFGDTWPVEHATDHQDSVAWTTARSPGDGVPLTFVAGGDPPRYRSPVITMPGLPLPIPTAEFDVPCSGFSALERAYVFYTLDHRYDDGAAVMVRTALTRARDGELTDLEWVYDASHVDHDGHFINIAPYVEREGIRGLPFDGPGLLLWGSGRYRRSNVYLAAVPLGQVEDRGAWRFYRGTEAGSLQPLWSAAEGDATALFLHPQVGELSVAWLGHLQLWLMLYNAERPRGINGRVAASPWGPWSDPVTVFDPGWPGVGYGHFMHVADGADALSDPGRQHEWAGEYGPYLVDRFTTEAGPRGVTVHFVLSTWNPYNTVLMRADVQRTDDVAVGVGVPSMVAAGLGREGHNLEVALPRTGGGLFAIARSADQWPPAWGRLHLAGSEYGRTDADRPPLDAVSLATTSAGDRSGVLRVAGLTGGRVVEWWRDTDDPWHWNGPFPVVADGGYPLEGAVGNPALVASSYGAAHRNLELVVPHHERGIHHAWWDADARIPCWRAAPLFGEQLGRVDALTMIQGSFGEAGNLELVARVGDRLHVMWRESAGGGWQWRGPFPLVHDGLEARAATGVPSLVQGRYGADRRNFELAVPMRAGGIALLWRDNDGDDPARWAWHLHTFVDPANHYDGVSLLEAPGGTAPATSSSSRAAR